MRRTRCLILWEKHFSAANLKIKLLTYVWTHSVRTTYILMLLPLVLRAIKNNIHICAKMQHLSVCTLSQCVCEQDVSCYDDFPPRATSLCFLNVSPPTSFEHFFLIITIIIFCLPHFHHHHTWYLSFFLHRQNFWRIEFTPKKRVNYTVNCQFFALLRQNTQ